MRQRIENELSVTVEGVDLNTVRDLVFWIRQEKVFLEYVPEVADGGTMLVHIPKEDAMRLWNSDVEMQFAFTTQDGRPLASDIVRMSVERLLKEAGYGPD